MSEVAKLIEQIDVEGTTAQNEVRIFRLKYTEAGTLQTVLQNVITGTNSNGGGQGQQGGGGGNAANNANGQVTPPSTKISIAGSRGGRVDSGILAGIVITADVPRTRSWFALLPRVWPWSKN